MGLFSAAAAWADGLSEADFEKARHLHLLKCAKCHKLYDIHDYEKPAWDQWMEKMKKKARLNEEQYSLIMNYFNELRDRQK